MEGDAVVYKQGVGLLVLHVRPGTFKGLVAFIVVDGHLRQNTEKCDGLMLLFNCKLLRRFTHTKELSVPPQFTLTFGEVHLNGSVGNN